MVKRKASYKGKPKGKRKLSTLLMQLLIPMIISGVPTWAITAYKFGYWEEQHERDKRREISNKAFYLLSDIRLKEFEIYFKSLQKKDLENLPRVPMDVIFRLVESVNKAQEGYNESSNKINALHSEIRTHFEHDQGIRISKLVEQYSKIWHDVHLRVLNSPGTCSEAYLNEEDAKADKILHRLQDEFGKTVFRQKS